MLKYMDAFSYMVFFLYIVVACEVSVALSTPNINPLSKIVCYTIVVIYWFCMGVNYISIFVRLVLARSCL